MIKSFTTLDLLLHKDPLTVEEAATLKSGGDSQSHSAAVGVLTTAIEGERLRASVERCPVYIGDGKFIGDCEYIVDGEYIEGIGNINTDETTIRMADFKAYCQSINISLGDSSSQTTQPIFDKTSQTYPPELEIALRAWQAVSTTQSKAKPKARIRAWLDSNTDLSNEAKERIATVANWDKTGGATRTE